MRYIARVPNSPKLRCQPLPEPFRIVLVEPEIPPNTGSVARTCAATSTPLHLIEPLGFRIDDRTLRRAGIDYWHLVRVRVHPDFTDFRTTQPHARLHLFSAQATRSYLDADLRPGDALVFGKESVGLPQALLDQHRDSVWGIPTSGQVRSLNLSNAVAIVLYEALRRHGGLMPAFVE
jgi:tRNA (cytidine/uridine-2'-O-)-methyltransferase